MVACFHFKKPNFKMEIENIVPVVLTIVYGNEIMYGDETEECDILEKEDNFAEETVPRFTNKQFKENFRMNPDTFEDFLRKLHSAHQQEVHPGQPQVSLEKQAMIAIWCLANMESLRSVALRFGISKSTCWHILKGICEKTIQLNRVFKFIWWPSEGRALQIETEFQRINGFSGVIGCLDGSHIRILPPKDHPNSYYNRKKFHSILLQGICDNRKLFTDVYCGEPGSMHDQRLLEKSDIWYDINHGLVEFPNNTHLVADLAYTLHTQVIVGFKNTGNLTVRQKNFNLKLSQIRVIIENAYASLKGRFRRLKYMETIRLDIISLLVTAACILHNICILNRDNPDEIMDVAEELAEERRLNVGMQVINEAGENRNAEAKRNNIVNNLRIARNLL